MIATAGERRTSRGGAPMRPASGIVDHATSRVESRPWAMQAGPGVLAGQRRGGCGIRTREGLPPTRFPSLRNVIHVRPCPVRHAAAGSARPSAYPTGRRRTRPGLRPRAVPGATCPLRSAKCSGMASHRRRRLVGSGTLAAWSVGSSRADSRSPGGHSLSACRVRLTVHPRWRRRPRRAPNVAR